jgi:sugar O-acyltransferase (sialic acid O-acetyltransferase NeuD family)
MKRLLIMGASGLAREVYDLAMACNKEDPDFEIKGFLSDGPSNIEEMGYPAVIGKILNYEVQPNDVFFCAIGKVSDRWKTIQCIVSQGGHFINLIHPSAVVSPSAKLGTGIAIKAYCVISNEVTIGDYSFLQSSVIVGHDVKIGRYCHINSFSFFGGCSIVNDLCTINAGARLVQNAVIEEGATVGIGSVVLNRVKKGTTVFGIPAKTVHF